MAALPSLQNLRFLVALVEEAHFGRAAARLNVTPSTLSVGIRELERTLGVPVAERSRREVTITRAGHALAARARDILLATQDLVAAAKTLDTPLAGAIRLGTIPTIGPYLLPSLLPTLRAAAPDLKLYLREELTGSLLEGLSAGRLDLALIALPFDTRGLSVLELARDGYHLAAPSDGTQTATAAGATLPGTGKSAADLSAGAPPGLAGNRLLLLERGHCLQRHALSAYPDGALSQDESFEATSLGTLLAMVGEGLGITLVPDLAVKATPGGWPGVSLTPLPDACPRTVALAWRPGVDRDAMARAMAPSIQQALDSKASTEADAGKTSTAALDGTASTEATKDKAERPAVTAKPAGGPDRSA